MSFFVVQSELGAVITDNQGHVLAQVVQNGPLIQVVPTGPLQVLAQEIDKSPQELAAELAALQQIVSLQAVGQQILELFLNPNSITPNHTQIEIDIPKTAIADQGTFGANDNNSNANYTATVTTTTTDQNGTTTTTTDQLVTQPNPAPQNSGTTVYWTGASDSNSANNANWSPAAPSSSNDVIIGRDQNDNPVPDATVAAGSPVVVHSLTLSDGAHLEARRCLGRRRYRHLWQRTDDDRNYRRPHDSRSRRQSLPACDDRQRRNPLNRRSDHWQCGG